MIFKFLPDARLFWRDVRLGAALTTALFLVGKYALGLYLVAQTLNDLGIVDSAQNRPAEARKAFAEALKIYRELAQKNRGPICLT